MMDLDLPDRRALVTGSSDGIGFAIAQGRASATTGAAPGADSGAVNDIG